MKRILVGSWVAMALVACGGSMDTRSVDDSSFGPFRADKGGGESAGVDDGRPDQRASVGSVTDVPGFELVDGTAFTFRDGPHGGPLVEVVLSNRPNICDRFQQSILMKNESIFYLDLIERDEQGHGIMPTPGVYLLAHSRPNEDVSGKFAGIYIIRLNEACGGADRDLSVATLGEVTITSVDPEVGVTGHFHISFDGGSRWVSGSIQVPDCSLPPEDLQPASRCR